MHNREENDRGDDHLDAFDERIAERLHLLAYLRIKMPQQYANGDCSQNLHIEVPIPFYGLVTVRRCCCCHVSFPP
jgi:hypothetical protein